MDKIMDTLWVRAKHKTRCFRNLRQVVLKTLLAAYNGKNADIILDQLRVQTLEIEYPALSFFFFFLSFSLK